MQAQANTTQTKGLDHNEELSGQDTLIWLSGEISWHFTEIIGKSASPWSWPYPLEKDIIIIALEYFQEEENLTFTILISNLSFDL